MLIIHVALLCHKKHIFKYDIKRFILIQTKSATKADDD
jgi:hypothetical protein